MIPMGCRTIMSGMQNAWYEDISSFPEGHRLRLAGYWIKSPKEDPSSSPVDYRTEKYSILDLFTSESVTLDPQERKERNMNLVYDIYKCHWLFALNTMPWEV